VGTLYGIIALGVTLTFGITGIVNFALGQFMMIGAYAAWHLTDITHLPYPISVALAALSEGIITKETEVRLGGRSHCYQVSKRHLSRLIDEQHIAAGC